MRLSWLEQNSMLSLYSVRYTGRYGWQFHKIVVNARSSWERVKIHAINGERNEGCDSRREFDFLMGI